MQRIPYLCPLLCLLIAISSCSEESAVSPEDNPPAAPVLISPADGASVDIALELSWDGSFSGYEVQVFEKEDDTTSIIWADTVSGTSAAPLTLARSKTYYWRVAGLWNSRRIWSDTRMFKVRGSASVWAECTFKLENIAVSLRVRTITTYKTPYHVDTSYSTVTDTLRKSMTFVSDTTADDLFSGRIVEVYQTGGSYTLNSWDLHVRFRTDDLAIDTMRYHETHQQSVSGSGSFSSSTGSTIVEGGGMAVQRIESGLYRMDASILENFFTVSRSSSASFDPRLSNTSTARSSTLIGYTVLPGAFIELRFK